MPWALSANADVGLGEVNIYIFTEVLYPFNVILAHMLPRHETLVVPKQARRGQARLDTPFSPATTALSNH